MNAMPFDKSPFRLRPPASPLGDMIRSQNLVNLWSKVIPLALNEVGRSQPGLWTGWISTASE